MEQELHRMVKFRRDLWMSSGQTLLLNQEYLEQVAQDFSPFSSSVPLCLIKHNKDNKVVTAIIVADTLKTRAGGE